ncbi:MAG: branched-chain amino acid transaminase [Planctomycetes bacterium]|nr:branched-chain amino acid transaminase [Planctomycetota bacterium]
MTAKKLSEKVWRNGEFINWEQATVHVCAHVIHYGSAVFEGVRVYDMNGKSGAFRLKDHVRRLFDGAKLYRMPLKWSQDEVIKACVETVKANKFKACYIRPIAYRDYGPMGVNPLGNPVTLDIVTWEWGAYLGADALEKGVDMQVSSWTRNHTNSTPPSAKCASNYASSALIKMDAISNGYAEGIALDTNGFLSEGSGENIFIIRDGQIYTPGLHHSILGGVTRDTIITLARELGIKVHETTIARPQLYAADEVFAVGTASEVTPVRSIDKITIGAGGKGPITTRIQKAYLDLVTGKTEDKWGYITRI